jgi:hypothetical protein
MSKYTVKHTVAVRNIRGKRGTEGERRRGEMAAVIIEEIMGRTVEFWGRADGDEQADNTQCNSNSGPAPTAPTYRVDEHKDRRDIRHQTADSRQRSSCYRSISYVFFNVLWGASERGSRRKNNREGMRAAMRQ